LYSSYVNLRYLHRLM